MLRTIVDNHFLINTIGTYVILLFDHRLQHGDVLFVIVNCLYFIFIIYNIIFYTQNNKSI